MKSHVVCCCFLNFGWARLSLQNIHTSLASCQYWNCSRRYMIKVFCIENAPAVQSSLWYARCIIRLMIFLFLSKTRMTFCVGVEEFCQSESLFSAISKACNAFYDVSLTLSPEKQTTKWRFNNHPFPFWSLHKHTSLEVNWVWFCMMFGRIRK